MKMIVGLGNPGKEYERTRHNAGFLVIDELARKLNVSINEKKMNALYTIYRHKGESIILLKPQTYMNLSGESIRSLADYYKIDVETELLVIFDDVSLDVGQIRIRKKGSAGGHNGIKNIIANLGTDTFERIKVGVGEKPKGYDLADYVLGHFTKAEQELMEEGYQNAISAVERIVQGEIDAAMNQFNKKVVRKE